MTKDRTIEDGWLSLDKVCNFSQNCSQHEYADRRRMFYGGALYTFTTLIALVKASESDDSATDKINALGEELKKFSEALRSTPAPQTTPSGPPSSPNLH